MSERGVFAVDRGIWDHPSFADEPLTEREAWQWLIGEAAFKDRVRRVGSLVVELARGQLAASTRFMADKWQWSEARVRRFLKRLKTDAMIDAASDAGITIITICNYNKYQRVSLPNDAASDAQTDAAATQQRRKTEDTKTIEIDSEAKASEVRPLFDDGWPNDFRERFWAKYPHKVGKPKALKKLEGIRKRAVLVSFEALMAGLDQYIRTKPPDRQWLNPETFLNQERWADQPAAIAQQGQNGRRTVHDAAKDLLAKVRAIDAEPPGGIRDGTGEPPLRLLSSR
jgi:quinol monooxygenase YgiN